MPRNKGSINVFVFYSFYYYSEFFWGYYYQSVNLYSGWANEYSYSCCLQQNPLSENSQGLMVTGRKLHQQHNCCSLIFFLPSYIPSGSSVLVDELNFTKIEIQTEYQRITT